MIRTDMIHGFLTEIFITHTIPDILTIGDGEDGQDTTIGMRTAIGIILIGIGVFLLIP
ncbi:MAG: hypothetical protein IPK61_15210 [Saprospiraceae bacterium]|nr:hypothetical protein [Saprospiraceae bacterium]